MTRLTIGMATYDDFNGVYFTLQALRLYHELEDVELLVVDNFGCDATRGFVEAWTGARYVLHRGVQGTAAPRDLVFREATGDAEPCHHVVAGNLTRSSHMADPAVTSRH